MAEEATEAQAVDKMAAESMVAKAPGAVRGLVGPWVVAEESRGGAATMGVATTGAAKMETHLAIVGVAAAHLSLGQATHLVDARERPAPAYSQGQMH